MKNLINFFFSFDKLMKEKLIVPFFWLSIILGALSFSTIVLETIWLGPLAKVLEFISFFVVIVFSLVALRLICELCVAIFRINNNLSPDGGKSELADIDPMAEARKAAEAAAAKARDLSKTAGEKASAATKTAVEKTKSAADSVKESTSDVAGAAVSKTKAATSSAKKSVKTAAPKKRGRPAGSKNKTTAKAAKAPAKKSTSAPKKRGRPAGSKNKTTAKTAKSTTTRTPKKRGPKPGSKAPRDAQGRLLKKDGTLRGKPGPKKK